MTDARRGQPHSLEAEETVVGGILLHPQAFNRVATTLDVTDFFHPALRVIYEAFVGLDASATAIDVLTVTDFMHSAGTFDKLRSFRGVDYLIDLQNRVVSLENIEHHAKIVVGKRRVRDLISVCSELAAKGLGGEYGDVDEFMSEAEQKFFDLRGRSEVRGPRPLGLVMKEVTRAVEERYKARDRTRGVPSGFPKHDELTAGYQPGDLVILAARPSMGKTTMAGNVVVHAAAHGVPALIFSLEMSNQSLAERMVASEGGIDSQALRTGRLTADDWRNLMSASSRLAVQKIWLDDTGTMNVLQLRAAARRWRLENTKPDDLALVVVDYIQLLFGTGKEENRQIEVANISRNLKGLAKELRAPVLALSQLSRKCEERTDKRPVMSDLRESGAIEQDADVIEFLYRDEVYHPDTEKKGIAEVIIGKQRNGPTGTTELRFRGGFNRFESLTEPEPQMEFER